MSDSDQERTEQRRRRRRAHTAQTAPSDDRPDPKRYTKLIEARLRKACMLEEEGVPIVATQTRHVNNWQHAIPLRQQFMEQIAKDCEYIDRKIEADRQRQADKMDKENAVIRRQIEAVHAKKIRELELINNRGLVRELLEEHLKNATPEGQLRRILQLEEDYSKLRQEHDQLIQRVSQNELKCNQDKHEHDKEINKLNSRFDQNRLEFNEYKKTMTKTNADLEAKLKELQEKQQLFNEKQEEHGMLIDNLSLQQDTIKRLSQEMEQLKNARRSDLDKLDQFTKRLDNTENSIERIREGLALLDRIPSLEREIAEIRKSLIQPSNIEDLELRLSQTQRDIVRHTNGLTQLNERLSKFESLYLELKQRIDNIISNDLRKFQEHLQSIDDDLERKSSRINEANTIAKNALDQIDQVREYLATIRQTFSDLKNKLDEMENIKDRLHQLEMKGDDRSNTQLLEELNKIRAQLEDLAEKQRQLANLASDLDDLKRMVNDLNRPITTGNELDQRDSDALDQTTMDAFLERVKREVMDSVSNLLQQLNEQIIEAKTLIGDLKAQIDEFLRSQQRSQPEPPPIMQSNTSSHSKRIPYVESLSPIDLLDDIWT